METGTLKWFDAMRVYGFIQPGEGGPDVFVHATAVQRAERTDLPDGLKDSYELVADKRSGKMSSDQIKAM